MPLPRIVVLEKTLIAAGVPVVGVSNAGPPYPAGITVQYMATATAEQIAQGEAIKAGFDYRPRRSLTRQQIVTGLNNLTQTQRNTVLLHLMTLVLRQNAEEVDAALAETGVPLAVDEVVP